MRKYLVMLMLIPLLSSGQTKTVITSSRFFAKNDKAFEFKLRNTHFMVRKPSKGRVIHYA